MLETYLHKINSTLAVVNNGCGGAYSYQIKEHLKTLVSHEDDIVFVLLGLNDRKRTNGLKELKENLDNIIERLIAWKKTVVLLTPNPSVHSNEYYENRIYHTEQIVEIIFNADGVGDGLHPGDFVQKLMFENIISELGIQKRLIKTNR